MAELSEAFTELARSTAAFHERFETITGSPTNDDFKVAMNVFLEEVAELQAEHPFPHGAVMFNPDAFAEEWADVLATMFGLARAASVHPMLLIEAMLKVAAKNDAKTHETHAKDKNGKVTSRKKLEQGNG